MEGEASVQVLSRLVAFQGVEGMMGKPVCILCLGGLQASEQQVFVLAVGGIWGRPVDTLEPEENQASVLAVGGMRGRPVGTLELEGQQVFVLAEVGMWGRPVGTLEPAGQQVFVLAELGLWGRPVGTMEPEEEHLASLQALVQALMGGEAGFRVVDMGKDNRKTSTCCSENGQAEGLEALVEVVQDCILPCPEEASQQQVHLAALLALAEGD